MEATLGQMSLENEARYNKLYAPAFKRYVKSVEKTGSPGAINMAAGLATSGVSSDMSPKIREMQRGASLSGVSPNSGAAMMANTTGRGAMGTAMGNAAFGAKMGQRNAYLSQLQNAIGIGKQQSGAAQQSMADVAGLAQQRAETNRSIDMAQSAQLGGALGSALGLVGGNAYMNRSGR